MVSDNRQQYEALKSGGMLPSPQGVAMAIARMALRDDVGTVELTRLIKTDPAMAGRLLRYANSASGGSRRHIASLSQAVMFLGIYRIRQLALAFSLIDLYRSGPCPGFDYPRYWSESLATGVGAQVLCGYARVPAEDSFSCGLLANIGRLGLATAFPAEYGAILARHGELSGMSASLCADERATFAIDHAGLSGEMLADWGLPSIFADAVGFHENPAEAPFAAGSRAEGLCWMLHLAALVAARLVGPEGGGEDGQALYFAAARIGLEAGDLQPTIERIQDEWLAWGKELGLPGQARDIAGMLAEEPAAAADAALVVAPMRVVLVSADRTLLGALSRWLNEMNQQATVIDDWSRASEHIHRAMPDVLLVDPRAAGMPADEALRTVRRAECGHRSFVVALLPVADEAAVPDLIRAGADDYLLLPPAAAAFQARMHAAQRVVALQGFVRAEREASIRHSSDWARSNRRLLHDALSDALTQLPNRRYGMDHLLQEFESATQAHLPLAVIMLDIDHFKRVNDTWGHAVGDDVLRQIALVVQNSCRKNDVVFRYGGEEFCVVCPATATDDAVGLAERILDAVRSARILSPACTGGTLQVTVSAGVATLCANADLPESLMAAADAALYRAKTGGRDCVRVAAPATGG